MLGRFTGEPSRLGTLQTIWCEIPSCQAPNGSLAPVNLTLAQAQALPSSPPNPLFSSPLGSADLVVSGLCRLSPAAASALAPGPQTDR